MWDGASTTKTFRHPWPHALVGSHLETHSRVLDVGCGQGRILGELLRRGIDASGTDTSSAMLDEARRVVSGVDLRLLEDSRIPWGDATFDAVSLLTVLTAVPRRGEQHHLVAECHRVLRPGGILVVSDLPLQWDRRHRIRYAEGFERYGDYGVWDFPDGGTVRHHDLAYFRRLVAVFDEVAMEEFPVQTMNGNPARAFRYLGRAS